MNKVNGEDTDTRAPLVFAGVTSYGAVKNPSPDDNVVVLEIGIDGNRTCKSSSHGSKIIAMDIDDQKIRCKEWCTINSKKEDPKSVMGSYLI